MKEENDPIKFVREKDLLFKKKLGKGGCGETYLLYDETIREFFVCKKHSPMNEDLKKTLYNNFIKEIKFLYTINHPNIVRVFNYYMYPKHYNGYILMEYIEGDGIDIYIKKYPENINELFLQTIDGFCYLENNNILHRDIRAPNIMVTENGIVKIIDFGFSKKVNSTIDFGKSVSLNWWCDIPKEFGSNEYTFQSEVYFIGKLFEKLIKDNHIEIFKYSDLLSEMCLFEPDKRIETFQKIKQSILSNKLKGINFEDHEIETYRTFSNNLHHYIAEIEDNAKYYIDVNDIQNKLDSFYKRIMLESSIPDVSSLANCFINGSYTFYDHLEFSVDDLKHFIDLLRLCPIEKKNIILSNIHSKLDSIERYHNKQINCMEDEIPF